MEFKICPEAYRQTEMTSRTERIAIEMSEIVTETVTGIATAIGIQTGSVTWTGSVAETVTWTEIEIGTETEIAVSSTLASV